jgi:tripartite-type tricarboxylate transporter receptor subunit TctC
MRYLLRSFSALLIVLGLAGPAAAEYPEKPITFIVGQSVGGGTDVFSRLLVDYMEKYLGEGTTITVLNKPGASGELGFTELAQAEPDGYTLGILNIPNIVTQVVTKDTAAFSLDDFTYLGKVYAGQASIVVPLNSQFETLADFVAYAKENPGVVTIAIGGLGADDHLLALQFMKLIDAEFTLVPMGDGARARNAVMGGHVTAGSMGLVDGYRFRDKLRALGVMWPDRLSFAPDVPTFKEQGYDISGGATRIVAAPANLPPEINDELAKAVEQAANDPEFLAEAEKLSSFVDYAGPEDAEAFIREQERILSELWASSPW